MQGMEQPISDQILMIALSQYPNHTDWFYDRKWVVLIKYSLSSPI